MWCIQIAHQILQSFCNPEFVIKYIAMLLKNQSVLNDFMKRSYLDISDLLQFIAVVVKLQENSTDISSMLLSSF